MRQFSSWRDYREFARRVRFQNRYFRDVASDRFFKTVIATSSDRKRVIKAGSFLCRSQVGEYEGPTRKGDIDNEDQPFALLPSRMIPLKNRAMEGRANPKGIPYLYLASDKETAIAESRAGRLEPISVGTFRVVRDLVLIDCSVNGAEFGGFYFKEPSPKKRDAAVWRDIDQAFSHPVNRSDDSADYAPTQVLAELFKQNGFDGILFRSSLADGFNVVLFNVADAELTSCCLFEVRKINLEIEQAGNPYVHEGGRISWNTIEFLRPAKPNKSETTPP